MNQNRLLRKIYAGEFKPADFTLEELSSGDRIDINYADSAGVLSFEDKEENGEFVLDFMGSSGEDSNDYVVSILGNHLNGRSGLKRRISEYSDEIEYYHRFNSAKTKRNLKRLETGLKEIFEEDYIAQTPYQLKKTLSKDRAFLQKVIGRRIGDKKITADEDAVFDFKPGYSNPILVDKNKLTIKQRTNDFKLDFSIESFAAENDYIIKTPDMSDLEIYNRVELQGKENVGANDVVKLLQKVAYVWNETWNFIEPPKIAEKVIKLTPVIVPKEKKTVFDSSDSLEAGYISKMMGTLPPKKLQYILGKCNGYDWKSRREGKRSIEVEFEICGESHKQRIDITKSRISAEFSVNTADGKVAGAALDALYQVLLDETKDYGKVRRNRYWE